MLEVGGGAVESGEVMPIIRKKEREYMGMFEYDRREEMQIIKVLIYGMYQPTLLFIFENLPQLCCSLHLQNLKKLHKTHP